MPIKVPSSPGLPANLARAYQALPAPQESHITYIQSLYTTIPLQSFVRRVAEFLRATSQGKHRSVYGTGEAEACSHARQRHKRMGHGGGERDWYVSRVEMEGILLTRKQLARLAHQ